MSKTRGSILQYFRPSLTYNFPKTFVLSIFKWPLKTGFTVCNNFLFQVLVTKPDFQNEFTRTNLHSTLQELMSLNIIPIINANDTVAPPPEPDKDLAGVR